MTDSKSPETDPLSKSDNGNAPLVRDPHSLVGKLLLAMPGMGDPRFNKAVIFVCAHDENGAMGIVVNHPMDGVELTELFDQLDIDTEDAAKAIPVMSGGPVEKARGFILHSTKFRQDDTIDIDGEFAVTGTIDALKAIATGDGPDDMIFALGYAGWSAGQLDQEMQHNAWLVVEPDKAIVFQAEPAERWVKAINKLGIDPAMLSAESGTA